MPMTCPRVRPIILLLVLPSRCIRLGCGYRARCGAAPSCSRFARSRFGARIIDVDEPVLVQALVPKLSVEGIDEGVVRGFTGPDEVEPRRRDDTPRRPGQPRVPGDRSRPRAVRPAGDPPHLACTAGGWR